jgi:hypothetical protein
MTRTRAWLPPLLLMLAAAAILLARGRPPICACGRVTLWVSSSTSPETSQMLADWYSASHIVHGLLFYAALWLVARRWPVERRFLVALAVEASWEIAENSPWIIDRYRSATSDIMMMGLGFLLARRLPLWAALLMVVVLELVPLAIIRDNLTLNVIMLLHPVDAIRTWQAGA